MTFFFGAALALALGAALAFVAFAFFLGFCNEAKEQSQIPVKGGKRISKLTSSSDSEACASLSSSVSSFLAFFLAGAFLAGAFQLTETESANLDGERAGKVERTFFLALGFSSNSSSSSSLSSFFLRLVVFCEQTLGVSEGINELRKKQ